MISRNMPQVKLGAATEQQHLGVSIDPQFELNLTMSLSGTRKFQGTISVKAKYNLFRGKKTSRKVL